MKDKNIKKLVRESYGRIAKQYSNCCGNKTSCSCSENNNFDEISKSIEYTEKDIKEVPVGSNLGLGCGNPIAYTSLKEGETVLDLGSGAGFDCFLAANKVGVKGKVIGVDMTPEMLEKARENALKGNYENIEFRLGEIENLPVGDNSVDVVISNCVINLSADKQRVFREVYRVLKPGGRIAISDIALLKSLPKRIQESIEAYVGCVGGAVIIDKYKRIAEASGLKDVRITVKGSSECIDPDTKGPLGRAILDGLGEDESLEGYVVSVYVDGHK
jgi:SAM-dependent methyltransferase